MLPTDRHGMSSPSLRGFPFLPVLCWVGVVYCVAHDVVGEADAVDFSGEMNSFYYCTAQCSYGWRRNGYDIGPPEVNGSPLVNSATFSGRRA